MASNASTPIPLSPNGIMLPPSPPEFVIVAGRSGLIGAFIAVFLCGMAVLQTHNYFSDYPTDRTRVKALVWLITLLNLLHAILAGIQTYHYTVGSAAGGAYGQSRLYWSTIGAFGLHIAIACIVLLYFTHISYSLVVLNSNRRTQKIACAFLVVVILGYLAFGTVATVKIHEADSIANLITSENLSAYISMASTQLSADILISLALCLALPTSGFKRTQSVVQRLIVYTVSRGILTAVAAFIQLIAVVITSHGLWFVAAELVTPGLYANSFLASLNTRKRIRRQLAGNMVSILPTNIPLDTFKPSVSSYIHQASLDDGSTQATASAGRTSVYITPKHEDPEEEL